MSEPNIELQLLHRCQAGARKEPTCALQPPVPQLSFALAWQPERARPLARAFLESVRQIAAPTDSGNTF